jgi:ring-1,2-phenylacetyl-CoA epoxidase subunit PaaE
MSVQFHKLKVRDLRRETADTVSISFELSENEREAFRFKQGQHLTLKVEINGEEVRRSYSICTGAHENDLRVAVKKVDNGVFSTWANEQLKVGDWMDVMVPQGHFFTELQPENEKNIRRLCCR